MSAELAIIILNVLIIVIAYFSVYPKVAGADINKVALCDCVASSLALVIVASKYWGTAVQFDFLIVQVNWFWFTLLSYGVIELPIALWYFRKLPGS